MWTILHNKHIDEFFDKYPALNNYAEDLILYTFQRDNNIYHVLPRLFYKNYPFDKFIVLNNPDFSPAKIDFNLKFPPKKDQIPIISYLEQEYKDNKKLSGIIHAKLGIGKTYISIYLSHMIKQRPIFIVDGENLIEQWTEEILRFTDLKPDEIGYICSKRKYVSNCKMYIGLIQTFVSKVKSDPNGFYKLISEIAPGIVVYDECHATSSESGYAKASIFFDTENIIGLSATPRLPKRKRILLFNTIGGILCTETNYKFIPHVRFYIYNSGLSKGHQKRIQYCKTRNRMKMIYSTTIHKYNTYLHVIYKIVRKILENQNRRVLIICLTINQIKAIESYLKHHNIDCRPFYSKEREIDKTRDRVVIAIYRYGSRAFNYKEITDLILASPLEGHVSLVQSAGRTMREYEGKEKPMVHDLIDEAMLNLFNIKIKKKVFKEEFKNVTFEIIDAERI